MSFHRQTARFLHRKIQVFGCGLFRSNRTLTQFVYSNFFASALFLIVASLRLSAQSTLRFDQLTIADGLSSNTVYTVYQDRNGMLWFGTLDGLNRYDGYSIAIYKHDRTVQSSLPNNRITMIYEDSNQHLWLYDEFTSLLIRYTPYGNTFKSYDLRQIAGRELEVLEDFREESDGSLYLCSKLGTALRYKAGSDTFEPTERQTTTPRDESSVVLHALDQHLKENGSSFSIESLQIRKVLKDSNGMFWIATTYAGLITAIPTDNGFQFTHHSNGTGENVGVENEEILDIYEDRSQVVWISTRNNGLYRYTPFKYKFRQIHTVQTQNGQTTLGTIRAITQDRAGRLWIGTSDQGLFRIDPSGKGYQYLPDTRRSNTIGHRFIRSLWIDEHENLWVGHYHGFSRYDPVKDGFVTFKPPTGDQKDVRIYDIEDDRTGGLWMAGWDVIIHFDPESNRYHIISGDSQPNLSMENIRDLELDDEGSLWIVTGEKGMALYDKKSNAFTLQQYSSDRPAGLPTNNLFDTFRDSKGNLWLSTADGLCRYDVNNQTCETFTTHEGLPSNMIFGLLEDRAGMLWFGSTKGIGRFDPAKKTFRNYDVDDGLPSNEFTENAFYKNQDGLMYFGGIHGLTVFDPVYISENSRPPQIAITALRVFDKPLSETRSYTYEELTRQTPEGQEIHLTADQRSFSIEFAALHYVNPQKNQYAYMLEGFDEQWTYRDANVRFANYTNLESGSYVFKVRASNSDGVWCDPVALTIVIDTPFYATWWFLSGLLALLLSAGIIAYRWRIQTLKQQQSLKAIQLESELNFLKSQVNPHFLFNTLNNIYALCQVNSRNAAPMVGKISEMMRYMIYDCIADEVPLQKEIEYLQNYIDLNQLKSHRKLNASITIDGSTAGLKIAPLMLINFLENSFKHGDLNQNGQGYIQASVRIRGHELTFQLRNSYRERQREDNPRRGIGLNNVRHRLELLYPDRHQLKIIRNSSIFEVDLNLILS